MKAPIANCTIGPILSASCEYFAGGNRASNHSWYVSKSNSGSPTRKFDCPYPRNGVNQLSACSRLRSKASMLGDFGATMPQPKMPMRLWSAMGGGIVARRRSCQGNCIGFRPGFIVKRALLVIALAALVPFGCARQKNAATSTQPTTQTIAPATAQPAPNGTDPMTQTVDIDDSRSEGEGMTSTASAPPAKTPARPAAKKKGHK